MPTLASADATWLDSGTVQLNAQELRRADAAMFGGSGAAFSVPGGIVRHGDSSLAVTCNASDVVTVQPGAVVVPGNAGTSNGAYRTALGTAAQGALDGRNGTNPRIDRVVFRVLDTDVVSTHGGYIGRVEIVTGQASSSPVLPDIPSLSIELARLSVPASGGGAVGVDSTVRIYATAIGGTLAVTTASRLPASAARYDRAVALDTGVEYRWNGTQWINQSSPIVSAVLAGSWTRYSTTEGPAEFYRTAGGEVQAQGLVKGGSGTIFTFDDGYRPAFIRRFAVIANGAFGFVQVSPDGTCSFLSGNNAYVALDQIRFRAATS